MSVGSSQSKLKYLYKAGPTVFANGLVAWPVYPAGSLFAVAKEPFRGSTPRGNPSSGTQQSPVGGLSEQVPALPHSAPPVPGSGSHGNGPPAARVASFAQSRFGTSA